MGSEDKYFFDPGSFHLRRGLRARGSKLAENRFSSVMRKRGFILFGIVAAAIVGAIVFSFIRSRVCVAMTLVSYQRWPHGAMIRLTNGSRTTITYFAEPNGTPAGGPLLCLQSTPT